jgi:hypothetical protein
VFGRGAAGGGNSQHCGVTNLYGYLDFEAKNRVSDVSEIFATLRTGLG